MKKRLAEPAAAIREVFANRGLRHLGLAYLFSVTGLWAYSTALAVYAFDIGGATLVGVAALVRLIPAAIAAPFTAVLADRYPRQRVLLVTNILLGVLIAAAATAVAIDVPPALVFTIGGTVVLAGTTFEPAKNSLLPQLAEGPEQLTAANVTLSSFESASLFIGPALGGAALAIADVEVAFAITAALLALAALQIVQISAQPQEMDSDEDEDEQKGGALKSIAAGFQSVRADGRLQLLFGLTSVQIMVDGMLSVLLVAMAFDLLDIGEAGVGWLSAVVGIGGLAGAAVTLSLTGRKGLGTLLAFGLAGWGAPIAVIGLAPEIAVAVAMMIALGVANTVIDACSLTVLQRVAPEDVMGRIFGLMESLIIVSFAVGSLLAPLLIALFDLQAALVVTGLILPALALIAFPALSRIDRDFAPPTERIALLRGIPIFSPLGPAALERLAGALEPTEARAGEEVITQGEEGDRFYVIEEGEVEVFEDGRFARRQGPGEHFGEIALLRDIPRTATVTAVTQLRALALPRKEFLDAVTNDHSAGEAADAIVAARLGSVHR